MQDGAIAAQFGSLTVPGWVILIGAAMLLFYGFTRAVLAVMCAWEIRRLGRVQSALENLTSAVNRYAEVAKDQPYQYPIYTASIAGLIAEVEEAMGKEPELSGDPPSARGGSPT